MQSPEAERVVADFIDLVYPKLQAIEGKLPNGDGSEVPYDKLVDAGRADADLTDDEKFVIVVELRSWELTYMAGVLHRGGP